MKASHKPILSVASYESGDKQTTQSELVIKRALNVVDARGGLMLPSPDAGVYATISNDPVLTRENLTGQRLHIRQN